VKVAVQGKFGTKDVADIKDPLSETVFVDELSRCKGMVAGLGQDDLQGQGPGGEAVFSQKDRAETAVAELALDGEPPGQEVAGANGYTLERLDSAFLTVQTGAAYPVQVVTGRAA
jgi:hypothetical protein